MKLIRTFVVEGDPEEIEEYRSHSFWCRLLDAPTKEDMRSYQVDLARRSANYPGCRGSRPAVYYSEETIAE